jgi:NTE family protein
MDGGISSSANLDLVDGCEMVVMLAPTAEPGVSPFGRCLSDELAGQLFGRAFAFFADEDSIAAFGRNPLDPGCRAPAAAAGRREGRRRAAELAAFLNEALSL